MRVTVFDGAESIGGNKIYVQEGEHGVFLDFGLNFAVSGKYFKEFIKIRDTRGLNDPLEMGLLPNIDIYRRDLYPLDLLVQPRKIRVDAVLISHAHVDHYGMLGYLDFDIPMVASPETLALIKAFQDSERSNDSKDAIYSMDREMADSDPRVLKKIQIKTDNVKREDKIMEKKEEMREHYRIRPLIPTEKLSDQLMEFMHYQGDNLKINHFENNMYIGSLEELPFIIRAYPVDHSIYGSTAFVIEGDTTLAYTGDLRLHGERGSKTLEFAKSAKDASILITEGTRTAPGEHEYVSEDDVKEKCREVVESEKSLVIADFSPRNFERLKIFSEIARKTSRTLVITEKDAYAVEALIRAGTNIDTGNIHIYKKLSDDVYWWQEYLGRTKIRKKDVPNRFKGKSNIWVDRFVDPKEIRENPGDYILAFSLYDMPNLMDIKPDGGLYLYSSTEAFSEDMELDFITLANWLERYSMTSVGFRVVNGKPEFEKGYHASGHAGPEELERIIDIIDPEVIIPVHTVNPRWFVERYGERVRIPRNGEEITF